MSGTGPALVADRDDEHEPLEGREQCLAHVQQPSTIPLPDALIDQSRPANGRCRWAIAAASLGVAAMVLAVLLLAGGARDGDRKQQRVAGERREGTAHHEFPVNVARGRNAGLGDDAIPAQIDRAKNAARRLESDVRGPPTDDDAIESELDRVDRRLRSLEADVLESLGED